MFDIGFWELAMVGVIALLVIGPERLPKVARTTGMWVGRARRMLASVKADIDRELKAEELKQVLEKQAQSSGVHDIIEETRGVVEDLNKPESLVQAQPQEPHPAENATAESRRSDES